MVGAPPRLRALAPMALVERYLDAVRFFLPQQGRDDIVREVSAAIAAAIADRTTALGREITEAEVADILRRHGHPALVAGRYRQRQQLIGPAFFPIYVLALKLGIAAAAGVSILLAAFDSISRGVSVPHLLDGFRAFPGRALMVFAWTTIAFALLDAAGSRSRLDAEWDPRRLPDWMAPRRPEPGASRITAGVDVVFGLLALGWLLAVPTSPTLALGPLAGMLAFAPVWSTWYVPLVVVAACRLMIDAHVLVWPGPNPRRIRIDLALDVAQILVAACILSARRWVVPGPDASSADGQAAAGLVEWVNVAIGIGFASVIVITLVGIGRKIYRLTNLARAVR